jgi:hypothetical protein
MTPGRFKSFQVSSCLCARRRKREREKEGKKDILSTTGNATPLWFRYSKLLCSQLFIIGKGVIAQAPSVNNNTTTRNTNNTTSKINSKTKKMLLSTLNNNKKFF